MFYLHLKHESNQLTKIMISNRIDLALPQHSLCLKVGQSDQQ
jgi:hypothetical protein